MMKFFKTDNGEYINLSAIQAITAVKTDDLYDGKNDLSLYGRQVIKLFDDSYKRTYLGGSNISGSSWYWDRTKVPYPNKTIAYTIHTNIPSGGMNNSHLMFHITPSDMEVLMNMLNLK